MESQRDKMNNASSSHNKSPVKGDKGKKPFDKERWRQATYSNKYQVDSWNAKRKKALLKEIYHDLVRKNQGNFEKPTTEGNYSKPVTKLNLIMAARLEYNRRQNQLKRDRSKASKAQAERYEAMKKYKERKTETYKKLSKRTEKGQPVMKDRIELLLEKIQLHK